MKPRIEKKISKKLAVILGDKFGKVWIDTEIERWKPHYEHQNKGVLSPKQKRENYQQRVSVNNVPSVGGGTDYWGEGQDWHTLYRFAIGHLPWHIDCDVSDGFWPAIKDRINARWALREALSYISGSKAAGCERWPE